ncbi:MAG: GNAT family N-acetyltransferase [Clostridiales bacterium]|jgi:ribosomal-protein-alanine N-acetyltransferase|nr:GNAT family N-acetyltransferase [Clostridiales bacterium]
MSAVRLRKWRADDADNILKYADNKKIADNLRNVFPHPYTKTDAEDYINLCLDADESKNLFFAIEADGTFAGSIGLFVKDDVYCKSAETGYWLGEPFWGKGIMTEALKQLCTIGFETFDITRIYAEPFAHNTGSRRVLEKAGFNLEGVLMRSIYKNGQYHDSCIYAILSKN